MIRILCPLNTTMGITSNVATFAGLYMFVLPCRKWGNLRWSTHVFVLACDKWRKLYCSIHVWPCFWQMTQALPDYTCVCPSLRKVIANFVVLYMFDLASGKWRKLCRTIHVFVLPWYKWLQNLLFYTCLTLLPAIDATFAGVGIFSISCAFASNFLLPS
jgi:hypothetical protein